MTRTNISNSNNLVFLSLCVLFQDMVEMMTMDKEELVLDKEMAEQQTEELQAQLDALQVSSLVYLRMVNHFNWFG